MEEVVIGNTHILRTFLLEDKDGNTKYSSDLKPDHYWVFPDMSKQGKEFVSIFCTGELPFISEHEVCRGIEGFLYVLVSSEPFSSIELEGLKISSDKKTRIFGTVIENFAIDLVYHNIRLSTTSSMVSKRVRNKVFREYVFKNQLAANKEIELYKKLLSDGKNFSDSDWTEETIRAFKALYPKEAEKSPICKDYLHLPDLGCPGLSNYICKEIFSLSSSGKKKHTTLVDILENIAEGGSYEYVQLNGDLNIYGGNKKLKATLKENSKQQYLSIKYNDHIKYIIGYGYYSAEDNPFNYITFTKRAEEYIDDLGRFLVKYNQKVNDYLFYLGSIFRVIFTKDTIRKVIVMVVKDDNLLNYDQDKLNILGINTPALDQSIFMAIGDINIKIGLDKLLEDRKVLIYSGVNNYLNWYNTVKHIYGLNRAYLKEKIVTTNALFVFLITEKEYVEYSNIILRDNKTAVIEFPDIPVDFPERYFAASYNVWNRDPDVWYSKYPNSKEIYLELNNKEVDKLLANICGHKQFTKPRKISESSEKPSPEQMREFDMVLKDFESTWSAETVCQNLLFISSIYTTSERLLEFRNEFLKKAYYSKHKDIIRGVNIVKNRLSNNNY